MKEFNFNNSVKVKLTDFGIAILRQNYEELINSNPVAKKYTGEFEIKIDENGYTEMPLSELMSTFGQYLTVNQCEEMPFEATIMIDEQSLKELSVEKGKSI